MKYYKTYKDFKGISKAGRLPCTYYRRDDKNHMSYWTNADGPWGWMNSSWLYIPDDDAIMYEVSESDVMLELL